MGSLFNPQSSFWKPFGYLVDIVLLSICWLLCSIPLLTAGAATTALYDAAVHCFRFKEEGTYARFFRTFKNELKQASLTWLIWAAVWAGCFFILRFLYSLSSMFFMAGLVFMILPSGIICWVFPILSRFSFSLADLSKTAAAFAVSNILSTLLMVVGTLAAVYFCAWLWLPIFIMPALLVLFWSVFTEKAFKKYMPQEEE